MPYLISVSCGLAALLTTFAAQPKCSVQFSALLAIILMLFVFLALMLHF